MNQNYPTDSADTANNMGNLGETIGENKVEVLEDESLHFSDTGQGKGDEDAEVDDEGMDANINQAFVEGDLSPRQASNLKSKGGRPDKPLQVQTRSSKGRTPSCSQ